MADNSLIERISIIGRSIGLVSAGPIKWDQTRTFKRILKWNNVYAKSTCKQCSTLKSLNYCGSFAFHTYFSLPQNCVTEVKEKDGEVAKTDCLVCAFAACMRGNREMDGLFVALI